MESIALRVIRYSGQRQVYVGTVEQWSALTGSDVSSVDQAIRALEDHLKLCRLDQIVEARRFNSDDSIMVSTLLEQIEADRVAEENRLAQQEQEYQASLHRGEIMLMLEESSTRVQLGRRTSVAGIDLFEVSFELDQQVSYDQLVLLQSEMDLDVRLTSVSIEHATDTISTNYSRDYDGGESYDYAISEIESELVYHTVYL